MGRGLRPGTHLSVLSLPRLRRGPLFHEATGGYAVRSPLPIRLYLSSSSSFSRFFVCAMMLLIFCLVTICVSVLKPALPCRWFVRSVLVYVGTYPSPAMLRKSIERSVFTISSVVKCLPARFTFFSKYLYISSARKQVRKWALIGRSPYSLAIPGVLKIQRIGFVILYLSRRAESVSAVRV